MCKLYSTFILTYLFLIVSNTAYPVSSPKVTHKNGIDIQKVMSYPLPRVLARYCKDYKISSRTAKIHAIELKRYFILTRTCGKTIDMLSKDVDNLWHTFLLFTRDYQTFCHDMFGEFIHHNPL